MEELFATIYGTTGSVFYVDSVSGNASWNGLSSNRAITTLDAAVALCTANKGDIIFLMPGHKEDIGNAQIDLDVAGISVIGLGHGTARPQFTYDHANASIDIGANGVVVRNIVLYPSVTDVLVGIDIETTVTDTLLEDIEAIPGEDGAGVDDFDKVVELKATCTRTTIRRLKVRQHASGAGYIAGIHLNDASDDVLIEDCDIYILGAGVIAPINGITTLSTNLRIRGCTLMTDAEPGIELVTGTTGILQNNHIFTDLATIDAAVVADTMAAFENYYVEVGPESGALIGTPSVDD
jgi:hypothetical protein|tara:strand:- start:5116 stop:5997 length:882 start_codon:yes stop_codon:yes gene_type:complete